MTAVRGLALAATVVGAVALQVGVLSTLAVAGVVPNLVLLLVVAVALSRGPEPAAVLGFAGGLVLDLAPPADHVAGRWAIALAVVGYLAGRARRDAPSSPVGIVLTVAASSFVGTSIFALTGMLLRDPGLPVTEALRVVPVAVLYDVLLTPFLLPPAMRLLGREAPRRVTG